MCHQVAYNEDRDLFGTRIIGRTHRAPVWGNRGMERCYFSLLVAKHCNQDKSSKKTFNWDDCGGGLGSMMAAGKLRAHILIHI